jgi:8-oxo-dGTP pyrophosphatase MutT (NUDIX family)
VQTIDKLAWIHIVDRKILSTRTRGRDTYYIPGGKREGQETDHQALIREIKEELTIDLIPDAPADNVAHLRDRLQSVANLQNGRSLSHGSR